MSGRFFWSIFSVLVWLGLPASALAQWSVGQLNVASAGLPSGTIYGIIASTLAWLLGVLGFIAVAAFVISGMQYLLSAGDEGVIDRAKTSMKYAIIGVIVALMGTVVIRAINTWLTGAGDTF